MITNKRIAGRYLENGQSKKGLGYFNFYFFFINLKEFYLKIFFLFGIFNEDQDFLRDFIYKYTKKNAIVHDSYSCKRFEDSEPFPSKRHDSFCYISCRDCCQDIYPNQTNHKCPIDCRPKEHLDWEFC